MQIQENEMECPIDRDGNDGAEGGTRTPMGCPTRPSNVRVYQFHHFGTLKNVHGVPGEYCFCISVIAVVESYFFIAGCFADT